MSLIDFIEHQQKKSEKDRQKIRVALSGGITGTIFIVWLLVFLPLGLKGSSHSQLAINTASTTDSLNEAVKNIGKEFNDFKSNVSGGTTQTAAVGNAIG